MMNKTNRIFNLLFILAILMFGKSCYKEAVNAPNPFEEELINQDTVNFELLDIDPASIAGLYQNIFGPTCANVGCHDGTFEPDFRTIESSYHSLVYQTPVKNDGSLTYRVDPGNPNQSAILNRIAGTISPQMPIEVEPNSEWATKSVEFTQNIRTWIQNGALDLSGNEPQSDYIVPSLLGAVAKLDGELLFRLNGFGPLLIPDSLSTVKIYFAFDPFNNPESFITNELILGYGIDEFTEDISMTMEILNNPIGEYGLYGEAILFTHQVELDFENLGLTDDHVFMRVKVQESSRPLIEIPTDEGLYYIKEYMSFIRTN